MELGATAASSVVVALSVAARYRVMTELKRAGGPLDRSALRRRLPADADLDAAIEWLEQRGLVRSDPAVVASS